MLETIKNAVVATCTSYDLVVAFGLVAVIMIFAYSIAKFIKQPKMGSAIAMIIALILAYIGGTITGGSNGIADIPIFTGFALLGGSMFRDFTIISTAYGANMEDLKKAGLAGAVALIIGILLSFVVGASIAYMFGYTSPVDMTTIGGGTCTFVVGPVVGEALGASSDVIALSIAAGIVKSVLAMILTPFIAKLIKLDNPTSAMVYGGLVGSTSGVAGGLASTDPELVSYGAMVATFYSGLGCLLVPTVCYMAVNAIF